MRTPLALLLALLVACSAPADEAVWEQLGAPIATAVPGPVEGLRVLPGEPVVALVGGEEVALPLGAVDALLHPEDVSGGHRVGVDGVLRLADGSEVALDALPDGSPVVDASGRIAVLVGPTDRYPHGILGDPLEAEGVVVLDPDGTEAWRWHAAEPEVIESLAATWAELDGRPPEELLVTVASPSSGARLVALSGGEVVAEGDPIGQGRRWRHLLTVGDFGEGPEVVDVATPHIGGTLGFHRPGDLSRVATLDSVSTHVIGSRNLTQWVATDLDGSGTLELVVPSQAYDELLVVARSDASVVMLERVGLGGRISLGPALIDTDGGTFLVVATASEVVAWEVGA